MLNVASMQFEESGVCHSDLASGDNMDKAYWKWNLFFGNI